MRRRKLREKHGRCLLHDATPGRTLSDMLDAERIHRIAEHVREAQRLAGREQTLSHNDRMMTRLAMTLWVCRDAADELLERALGEHREDHQHGRLARGHCTS